MAARSKKRSSGRPQTLRLVRRGLASPVQQWIHSCDRRKQASPRAVPRRVLTLTPANTCGTAKSDRSLIAVWQCMLVAARDPRPTCTSAADDHGVTDPVAGLSSGTRRRLTPSRELAKIMAKMANKSGRRLPAGARHISAADAKNQFGHVLDTAIAGDTVAITRYGEVKAIMVSVDEYEALSGDPRRRLNLLTDHFDNMLAAMQTTEARQGMRAAFEASPQEMGRAAVEAARRRRAARSLG